MDFHDKIDQYHNTDPTAAAAAKTTALLEAEQGERRHGYPPQEVVSEHYHHTHHNHVIHHHVGQDWPDGFRASAVLLVILTIVILALMYTHSYDNGSSEA